MFSMIWKKLVPVKNSLFILIVFYLIQNLRVWMFPPSSLSTAEEVLCSVPGLAVEVSSVIKKDVAYCSNILLIIYSF